MAGFVYLKHFTNKNLVLFEAELAGVNQTNVEIKWQIEYIYI